MAPDDEAGVGASGQMSGNEHIALEAVALLTHIDEFGGHRQSGQGAIAIRNIAHHFRSCAQTA